jgi:hypothetical protein
MSEIWTTETESGRVCIEVEEDCQIVILTEEDCRDKDFDPYPGCMGCTGKPIYRPLSVEEVEELCEDNEIWHRIPDNEIIEALAKIRNLTYKGDPVRLAAYNQSCDKEG